MTAKPSPGRNGAGPETTRSATGADRFRGAGAPRPIGALAAKLMAKPLGKRGFAAASLAAAWPTIVGEALAGGTLPRRVVFARGARTGGVLHLRVASGALALQLQHIEPLILERINVHFGYAAVSRLTLTQGPVPRPARPRRPAPAPVGEIEASLKDRIATLPDADLRAALEGLGRRLAGGWQRS